MNPTPAGIGGEGLGLVGSCPICGDMRSYGAMCANVTHGNASKRRVTYGEQTPKIFLAWTHESAYLRDVRPGFWHRFPGTTRLARGELTGRLQTSGDPRWIQCKGVPQYNAPAGTHGARPTKPGMAFWRRPVVVRVAKRQEITESSRAFAKFLTLLQAAPRYFGTPHRDLNGRGARPAEYISRWFARVFVGILGLEIGVGVRAGFRHLAAEWRPVYQSDLVPPSVPAVSMREVAA